MGEEREHFIDEDLEQASKFKKEDISERSREEHSGLKDLREIAAGKKGAAGERLFTLGMMNEPLLRWEAEGDPAIISMARGIRKELGLPELAEGAKSAFEGLDFEQKSKVRDAIEAWKKDEESKRVRGATGEEIEEALW